VHFDVLKCRARISVVLFLLCCNFFGLALSCRWALHVTKLWKNSMKRKFNEKMPALSEYGCFLVLSVDRYMLCSVLCVTYSWLSRPYQSEWVGSFFNDLIKSGSLSICHWSLRCQPRTCPLPLHEHLSPNQAAPVHRLCRQAWREWVCSFLMAHHHKKAI